jgi:hypothetical protein
MSWITRWTNRAEEPVELDALDPALQQALGDFKASVHAWSQAAYSRPRTARQLVAHRTWRLAAGWGLAAVLLTGTLSGTLYERHHQQEAARVARAQEAEHQRQIAAQRALEQAKQEDDVLASVDKDVSREVPSAMEPLAEMSDATE